MNMKEPNNCKTNILVPMHALSHSAVTILMLLWFFTCLHFSCLLGCANPCCVPSSSSRARMCVCPSPVLLQEET